jgi:CDP-diacylglycerol--serine O-phosphatidyltransferase
MTRHIPNFITSLNLASGFLAIIFITKGETVTASWLILAAMVFDFLDGFASRLLNAYSDLGKELDSLADLVSFGVVPGLIIYTLLSGSLELSASAGGSHPGLSILLISIIPALIPVCAGLRLAKFNIDTTQTISFRGLPTPAAALAVVSLLLSSVYSDSEIVKSFISSPALIIVFSLIVSGMMVSRIPLLSFKFKSWGFKGNEGRYILLAVCAVLALTMQWEGIPLIIPAYIIISLFLRN